MNVQVLKSFLILFIMFIGITNAKAQEEFFKDMGGLSLAYGHSSVSEGSELNSFGASLVFNQGFTLGISSQQIGDETCPQFHAGFMRRWLDYDSFTRPFFYLSYVSSSYVSIISGNMGFSYLVNAQKKCPTSFSGIINLSNISYKDQYDNPYNSSSSESEFVPVVGFVVNQALWANSIITPYVGLGIAYDLNYDNSSYSIALGINLNFIEKLGY